MFIFGLGARRGGGGGRGGGGRGLARCTSSHARKKDRSQ